MITVTFNFNDISAAAALFAKLNGQELASATVTPEVAAAPAPLPKPRKASTPAAPVEAAPSPRTAEAATEPAAPATSTEPPLAPQSTPEQAAPAAASSAPAEPFKYETLQKLVFKHLPAHGAKLLEVSQKHGAAKFKELPADKWQAAYDDLVALYGE